MWVPLNWSRDRDLGRVLRVLDATLCVGPCTEFVYDARDILSLAANDCRDCLNSELGLFGFVLIEIWLNDLRVCIFQIVWLTRSRINQISRESWSQVPSVWMIRKTVMRLTISDGPSTRIIITVAVRCIFGLRHTYLCLFIFPTPEKCETWLRRSSAMPWFSIG